MTVTAVLCIYCGQATGATVTEGRLPRPEQERCDSCRVAENIRPTRQFAQAIAVEQAAAQGEAAPRRGVLDMIVEDDPLPVDPGVPPPQPADQQYRCRDCGSTSFRGQSDLIVYNEPGEEWLGVETNETHVTCRDCGRGTTDFDWI